MLNVPANARSGEPVKGTPLRCVSLRDALRAPLTEPPDLPEIGFADADQRTVHIDKPEGQEGKVMDASWITDEGTHCDACLSRPALGRP